MEKRNKMDVLNLTVGDFLGKLNNIDQPLKEVLNTVIKEFRKKVSIVEEKETNYLPFLNLRADNPDCPSDVSSNVDKYLYDE